MDKCSAHKTEPILKKLENEGVMLDLTPAGCTGLIQPLDTCINKPFKDLLRKSFEEWFSKEGLSVENKHQRVSLKVLLTID